MNNENWYINSNNLRSKKDVINWIPEEVISPEDEIKRLKAIIENSLECHLCEKDPDKCDYNKCDYKEIK